MGIRGLWYWGLLAAAVLFGFAVPLAKVWASNPSYERIRVLNEFPRVDGITWLDFNKEAHSHFRTIDSCVSKYGWRFQQENAILQIRIKSTLPLIVNLTLPNGASLQYNSGLADKSLNFFGKQMRMFTEFACDAIEAQRILLNSKILRSFHFVFRAHVEAQLKKVILQKQEVGELKNLLEQLTLNQRNLFNAIQEIFKPSHWRATVFDYQRVILLRYNQIAEKMNLEKFQFENFGACDYLDSK